MKKIPLILAAGIAAAVLTLAGFHWYGARDGSVLTIYGNVDIRTVNLGLRVGGRLARLTVDEGDMVSAGQVLGELDNQPFVNALKEAQASVMAQKAQLALMEEGYRAEEVAQVRSALEERKVAYEYAEKFYKRQLQLLPSRAVSSNDVDNARSARNQARAAYQAAKDKLLQYEAGNRIQEIEAARAQLSQAEAAQAQASLNLEDTVLRSPSAGVILTRAVEPGAMLPAGSTVFTLSLTRPVWVRAYVDEVNLGRAIPGTEVSIYTDGQPDKAYKGSVGFVSPTAEFTPKSVQTPELRTDLVYRLRIIVTDADDSLRQGMPVTIVFVN